MSEEESRRGGPSWGMMLVLLLVAILVASGIAYLMIYPYIHRSPY